MTPTILPSASEIAHRVLSISCYLYVHGAGLGDTFATGSTILQSRMQCPFCFGSLTMYTLRDNVGSTLRSEINVLKMTRIYLARPSKNQRLNTATHPG